MLYNGGTSTWSMRQVLHETAGLPTGQRLSSTFIYLFIYFSAPERLSGRRDLTSGRYISPTTQVGVSMAAGSTTVTADSTACSSISSMHWLKMTGSLRLNATA